MCRSQLIAKCPGSTRAKTLSCPTCKARIVKIEQNEATGSATVAIARQKTFDPSSFDPLSMVAHGLANQEAAVDMSGIDKFIDSCKNSSDGETAAAAEAAAKAWADGPELDFPAALTELMNRQRAPPTPLHPLIRAAVGAFTLLLVGVWLRGIQATLAVRADFDAYVRSDHFSVKVTRLDQFETPLNALIPSSREIQPGELAVPNEHQRYWALMPDGTGCVGPKCEEDLSDIVPNTDDILLARTWVFWVVVIQGTFSLCKSVRAVVKNHPLAARTLSNGLELVINMAMLCCLREPPSLSLAALLPARALSLPPPPRADRGDVRTSRAHDL